MEVIVILEKREEETQEATTNKDMIIVFPQLRKMKLRELENLKGVYVYKSEDQLNFNVQFPQLQKLRLENLKRLSSFNNTCAITETRPLFNHQVAFPALEELSIAYVPNITEIWDKNLLPTKSFCLLRSLKVNNCEKLMNVVSSHVLPQLKSIETLEVFGCLEMKVIVVLMEKKEEETQEATNKDMIIVQFPQLRILRLGGLKRLSSFNNTCTITETRPLFNHQVAFPALEGLSISGMPNITEIWDKNLLLAESFCLLRSLEVENCDKLMNVVPSHMIPLLKSIETLKVSMCPEMEVIVVLEKREEETQEATNKDMIIVQFPQLRKLRLENLKRLSSFNNTCTITETRSLFNLQVAFPTLEELFICGMPNITEIWDNNLLPVESFCLLRSLEVENCEKLMNVVPSHMLPQLKSIETLEVSKCPEMEVIVVLEKREEETQEATNKDIIIVFLQLREMKLQGLKNLKGVCAYKFEDQFCFNVQVEFPSLEVLSIISMPNITEIWDKNLLQLESFRLLRSSGVQGCEKLRSLIVENCEKLMNVVPSHMLPLLKNIEILKVENCPDMEVIVVLEKREEETQEAANKDKIIVFPKLRSLELRELENLKGVCAYKSEDQFCFNIQVAFPSLEELSIYEMPNITEIWDKNLLRPESFCLLRSLGVRGYEKLKSLTVQDCKKLMNVVPSHMFPLLKNIETLEVSKCPEMEVIVVLEKREEETQETTNKDIIVFPELWSLGLTKLENLKGVCAYKSEDRLCFNVQVVFPKLWYPYLDEHSEKIFTEATSNKKL